MPEQDIEKPLRLPVQNPHYAPSLIQYLEQHDVIIESAPEDPQTAVKAGDINVVLIIPKEYAEDFSSGNTATLQLVMDSSRQSINVDITRIRNLLENYGTYTGALRLIVRGVSPEVIQVVTIEELDVASPQSRAIALISFLPYFIIFAMFNGAAPIVTDTTAGERERQSLEPLLINPVPRRNFVLGKLLAAFPFSLASLGITLIGFGIVFNVLPVDEYLGIRICIGYIHPIPDIPYLSANWLIGKCNPDGCSFLCQKHKRSRYLPAFHCPDSVPARHGTGLFSRQTGFMDDAHPHLRTADPDQSNNAHGTIGYHEHHHIHNDDTCAFCGVVLYCRPVV